MTRIPLGKSQRFKIFARDGFVCQYCGRRPPDVILEVDHITAVTQGGGNDDLNLITSCAECNRGKSDKRLGQISPRPDADLHYLEMEQDRLEVERYLNAKNQRDNARHLLIGALEECWQEFISGEYMPNDTQWRTWLTLYSPDEIEKAIQLASPKYHGKYISRRHADVCSYISGILKRRSEEK